MNENHLESQLERILKAQPDPTPGWKAELLARAYQETQPWIPAPLAFAWAAAWLAIGGMTFLTPALEERSPNPGPQFAKISAESVPFTEDSTLFAFHRNELIDLP